MNLRDGLVAGLCGVVVVGSVGAGPADKQLLAGAVARVQYLAPREEHEHERHTPERHYDTTYLASVVAITGSTSVSTGASTAL